MVHPQFCRGFRPFNITFLSWLKTDLWTYIVGVSYNMNFTRGSRKGIMSRLNDGLYTDSDTSEIGSLPEDNIPSQTISLPGSSSSISVSNVSITMNTINHVDIPDISVSVTKRRGRKQRKKGPITPSNIKTRSKRSKLN